MPARIDEHAIPVRLRHFPAAAELVCLLPLIIAERHRTTTSRNPGREAVECWIGIVADGDRRIVRLAGRLSVAQVPELFNACAGHTGIELDLTDLLSADPAGIEALQRMRRHGATLSGIPGYIQLQLHTAADPTPSR